MTDAEFWDEVYRRGVGVAVRTPTGVEIIWPVLVSAETGADDVSPGMAAQSRTI